MMAKPPLLWLVGGFLFGSVITSLYGLWRNRKSIQQSTPKPKPSEFHFTTSVCDGFSGAIGNSPLIYLRSLSEETGCHIFGKAEFMNPGGSVKDRAAKYILKEAIDQGKLLPGGAITEGTVGSTGIALALQTRANGYACDIFMPDDVAIEKSQFLELLGCTVHRVPPVSIVNPKHYVNQARKLGNRKDQNTFFSDQFENLSNYNAHYHETGPEIWEQAKLANLKINAVIMGAGTGGTLSGISNYLREQDPSIQAYLVDPIGSGLFNKINSGVMYANEEAEGTRKRHQTDSIVEGVGINRLTANFLAGINNITRAFRCTDDEAVRMSRYLIKREGLFLGGSSAVNCVGAVKLARHLNTKDAVIITILCDGGHRYLSNLYNEEYLRKKNIDPESPANPTLEYVCPQLQ